MAKFVSTLGSATRALRDALVQRETERRQNLLDGLLVSNTIAERQRAEAAAQRQSRLDAQAENEALRRTAIADRDYADRQARQQTLDSRYESEQQQRRLDREDANAQKYLDTERNYFEADKRRQFEAAESARDRASQERRTAMGSAKPDKADSTDTRANDIISALDDLSSRINDQEGMAAKVPVYWCQQSVQAGNAVCHTCDTPRCVNPVHFFRGDDQANSDDKCRKGRHPHGESNARARLTADDVRRMRATYSGRYGEIVTFARHYDGVDETTIAAIVHRRSWLSVA